MEAKKLEYAEKLERLTADDFFAFFLFVKAEPRWVTSAGHQVIQILGLCHHGDNHSVIFDPTTLKCTCFSECGGGMLFHTWIKRMLGSDFGQDGKDFFEDWLDGNIKDLEKRLPNKSYSFDYIERPFDPTIEIPIPPPIPKKWLDEMWNVFDHRDETLQKLMWHKQDGIDVEILKLYDVCRWAPKGQRDRIILPHHNILGEICGLYERSFWPLRKEMKERYPFLDWKELSLYPRSKYLPLVKWPEAAKETEPIDGKTCWSFPNSHNLYGLHLAKENIAQTGKAIVFEGGKSVMLARQFGYNNTVATHTFGANINHIALLIQQGAKDIYLAFDKQYEKVSEDDDQWRLYNHRTKEFAEKVGQFVNIYRITDYGSELQYKDAPVDQGEKTFNRLINNAEPLVVNKELVVKEKKNNKIPYVPKKPDYNFGQIDNINEYSWDIM